VVHLDLQISPQIFEKIQNDHDGIVIGSGEDDSRKTRSKKSRHNVPLDLFLVFPYYPFLKIFISFPTYFIYLPEKIFGVEEGEHVERQLLRQQRDEVTLELGLDHLNIPEHPFN
jgi:hypothetical protein